jgi:hypothetical protein
LSFILQFNLHHSYFILALPPPLGREKKLPSKATPGGRLGAGEVFDISIVSPELRVGVELKVSLDLLLDVHILGVELVLFGRSRGA